MAWQVVLFCSWIFTVVQVVPYIIEEEIMESYGWKEDFKYNLANEKNRYKGVGPSIICGRYTSKISRLCLTQSLDQHFSTATIYRSSVQNIVLISNYTSLTY